MKTFNLNKKSWHFWLATRCSGLDYWEGHDVLDICTYSRKVLKGLFLFLFWTIFVTMIGIAYLISGYDFFSCLLDPVCTTFPQTTYLFAGLSSIVVGIFVIACGAVGIDKYREYRYTHPTEKKAPGFLTLWYRKFKEKTCFIVSFKD